MEVWGHFQVWGCFAFSGPMRDLLHLLVCGVGFMLQHDNDLKALQELLEGPKIGLDFNPKSVWRLRKSSVTSQEALWFVVRSCWDNMSHQNLQLVQSMPAGVHAVIKETRLTTENTHRFNPFNVLSVCEVRFYSSYSVKVKGRFSWRGCDFEFTACGLVTFKTLCTSGNDICHFPPVRISDVFFTWTEPALWPQSHPMTERLTRRNRPHTSVKRMMRLNVCLLHVWLIFGVCHRVSYEASSLLLCRSTVGGVLSD